MQDTSSPGARPGGTAASPATRYIGMFERFFEEGKMTSTYKAVFLRCMADIGRYGEGDLVGRQWIGHRGGKVVLDLDFVAARFAKYYWDMHAAFGLRHLQRRKDGRRDEIITLIKEEAGRTGRGTDAPPALEYLASDGMAGLRSKVIRMIFSKNVHKAVLNDMEGLYRQVGTRHIEFDSDLVGFMRTHARTLKNALNYSIAKHLEANNREARHIATMIETEVPLEERAEMIERFRAS